MIDNVIKNNLFLIFSFFVLLFLFSKFGPGIPFSVSQITTNKTEPFTVSAEGKVVTKPDIATVNVGFTANGATVSEVQNQANLIINKISADLKRAGIGEKDIQTTNYNLRPNYDYHATPQKIIGYIIDIGLNVKVRDFSKINTVIDTATADGANQIGNLNFTVEDSEKFKSEARKIAIDNAKKKASEIANASGITLGKIINVSEGFNQIPRPMMMAATLATPEKIDTNIEAGSSEISITVTLSYETR